jgi:iron complex transport system ATP-binding protein
MEPIYTVADLQYCLRGRPILRDIAFGVVPREYISIIGPNGAGKTTLLKHLNRIIPAQQAGSIKLKGRSLDEYQQKEIARIVAYVAQTPAHIQHFSVREFILMGRYPYLGPFASPSTDDDKVVDVSMEITDTARYAERDMVSLSGGELQKVYIAAGLAQGGEVVLLDEPATFLDPRHQHEIFTILQQINREGRTVITVTHDINTAVLTSSRIIALRDGRIIYDGEAHGVMDNQILAEVYDREFKFTVHPDTGNKIAIPEVYLDSE